MIIQLSAFISGSAHNTNAGHGVWGLQFGGRIVLRLCFCMFKHMYVNFKRLSRYYY